MAPQPVLFTVEFRRKMAQLSRRQRHEWLASLASELGAPRRGPRNSAKSLAAAALAWSNRSRESSVRSTSGTCARSSKCRASAS